MTVARPEAGVVTWNINTACNYRCSYCTQRFMDDRARWAADVPRFLAAFAKLQSVTPHWEIKLSGGEPFVHPQFTDVVAGLVALGFAVSVVSNFSASVSEVDDFLAAAGAGLRVFSASLHLEYIKDENSLGKGRESLDEFVAKAQHVQARLPAGASLNVTCVGTRQALPRLPALRERFQTAGVTFKIQPEKQDRDVIAYAPHEQAQLVALGGHNGTGQLVHNFKGKPCWAGALYFTLDDRGEAWRCYPARRHRREHLGNFLNDGFALQPQASPCLYDYCNCTVPIERKMMQR